MFNQAVRTIMTVTVALTVVLSMGAGPAMATQDDGLLGGDGSGDGIEVGGDSGVSVGTDGVGVGGDEGVNASTDGVSVAGEEVGTDTVPDDDDSSSIPDGDDGPIAADGSNVEVGGDSGVSVGTDGVGVGDDSGVSAGPDGVAGEEVGEEQTPGTDGLPSGDLLPGGGVAPGGDSNSVPTGPLPLEVNSFRDPGQLEENYVTIESAEDAPGPNVNAMFVSTRQDDNGMRVIPRLELSDTDRTYFDFDGDSTVSQNGLENADGAIYTVNESGGTYIVALSRDNVQAAGMGDAQGERVGVANVQNTPGTQQGFVGGGLFPAAIAGLGPSAPVGPEAPEELGGGVSCNDERCLTGTSGINESIPSNQATDPIKRNYPLPRTTDTSGTALPCSKPVTPDDLPAEQLPGLSDLPSTGAGLPTSLLTNDAVLGLAFGAAPNPCDVSDPIADPAANPAVEPGEYQPDPTFEAEDGSESFQNGIDAIRYYEFGAGDGASSADGLYVADVGQDEQVLIKRLDVGDSEYDYFFVETRGEQADSKATGMLDASLRDGYAGIGGDFENELGTGNGAAGLSVTVTGQSAGFSISCTPTGCQPDYEGLPKVGDLPTLPNPTTGDAGLPD